MKMSGEELITQYILGAIRIKIGLNLSINNEHDNLFSIRIYTHGNKFMDELPIPEELGRCLYTNPKHRKLPLLFEYLRKTFK